VNNRHGARRIYALTMYSLFCLYGKSRLSRFRLFGHNAEQGKAQGYNGPGNFVTGYSFSDAELRRSFAGMHEGHGLSTLRLMKLSSFTFTFLSRSLLSFLSLKRRLGN
jgi:hypothetical protein